MTHDRFNRSEQEQALQLVPCKLKCLTNFSCDDLTGINSPHRDYHISFYHDVRCKRSCSEWMDIRKIIDWYRSKNDHNLYAFVSHDHRRKAARASRVSTSLIFIGNRWESGLWQNYYQWESFPFKFACEQHGLTRQGNRGLIRVTRTRVVRSHYPN